MRTSSGPYLAIDLLTVPVTMLDERTVDVWGTLRTATTTSRMTASASHNG